MRSAAWSPDGRVLLLSFEGSPTVAAVHLVKAAPALQAQVMPLALPDMPTSARIQSVAWDHTGMRLAVGLAGGRVALYATRRQPLLAASLIGWLHEQQLDDGEAAGEPAEPQAPVTVGFQGGTARGGLLAVRWPRGGVSLVPLIF